MGADGSDDPPPSVSVDNDFVGIQTSLPAKLIAKALEVCVLVTRPQNRQVVESLNRNWNCFLVEGWSRSQLARWPHRSLDVRAELGDGFLSRALAAYGMHKVLVADRAAQQPEKVAETRFALLIALRSIVLPSG